MTAIILAGGLGTRLRSVVSDRPKVLAEVRGRPFLAFLLDELERLGIKHVVLASGYLGDQLAAAFGARYRGLELEYSLEPAPLGTGGALRLALPLIRTETCLVMNGDSFCEADLPVFGAEHEARGAAASLLLTRVADTSRYGRVELDDDGRVSKFEEKGAHRGPGWVNGGVYLIARTLLAEIEPDRPVSLERDCFPAWIGRGLYGSTFGGRFIDIGTPESYASAQHFFSRRRFVALDRDGTLIALHEYLSDPEKVELLPGAAEGLRALRRLGLGLVVVTNQSGVGRGYFTAERLAEIHQKMIELLRAEGIELDGIYYCPHKPEDECACRKPKLGLASKASQELGLVFSDSFVVGDNECDVELGRRMGATTFLVETGYGANVAAAGEVKPDYVAKNLSEVARIIESLMGAQ